MSLGLIPESQGEFQNLAFPVTNIPSGCRIKVVFILLITRVTKAKPVFDLSVHSIHSHRILREVANFSRSEIHRPQNFVGRQTISHFTLHLLPDTLSQLNHN
jgi:hypothetical protein